MPALFTDEEALETESRQGIERGSTVRHPLADYAHVVIGRQRDLILFHEHGEPPGQLPPRCIESAWNDWLTGMISIVLTFIRAGTVETQKTVSATSSGVSAFAPSYSLAARPSSP